MVLTSGCSPDELSCSVKRDGFETFRVIRAHRAANDSQHCLAGRVNDQRRFCPDYCMTINVARIFQIDLTADVQRSGRTYRLYPGLSGTQSFSRPTSCLMSSTIAVPSNSCTPRNQYPHDCVLRGAAHGQRRAPCARLHALHVHVRPEERDAACRRAVRLETLEARLREVEDARVRCQRDLADCARVSLRYSGMVHGRGSRCVHGCMRGVPHPLSAFHSRVSI